ncbi:cobalamin-binding protein [Fictibacillus iocasae]|uniref:Cobalamin-binding protein n=1 Tax=Fictibacillus iocasae TaxID=2715437 RepID=A0ABW2NUQ3_9BACL
MKIVSLCPSNTELLHYLDLIPQLVGVDDFSDFPETVNALPRVGPDLSIDMDVVTSLQPDLVLASLSVPGMEKNVAELNKRRIPHVVYNPQTFEDILNDLLDLGARTGKLDQANTIAARARKLMGEYKSFASHVSHRPSLYFEWWPKPVFTPGQKNWLTELSVLAGGRNAFADKQTESFQSDWEEVRLKNPDHICMVWVGVQTSKMKPELLYKRPGWNELKALVQRNIHVLDENLFCRPSPRLFKGLVKLAALLHPDIFPSYDEQDPLTERNAVRGRT